MWFLSRTFLSRTFLALKQQQQQQQRTTRGGGGGGGNDPHHQAGAELYREADHWGTERERVRAEGGGGRQPEQLPEHVFAMQMAKNQPWKDRLTVWTGVCLAWKGGGDITCAERGTVIGYDQNIK